MSKKFNPQTTAIAMRPLPKGLQKSCDLEVSYALAEADAFRDMLRAGLTKQVLDNTAVLAKLEEHYGNIAPTGSSEYRFIVQAYARASMMQVFDKVKP